MELIKDTVRNVIQSWQTRKPATPESDPGELLKKILTKKELGHIKVNYFKKGALYINVDSSTWLYHLNLRKEKILAKLRGNLSGLKEIRFFIGEI
ncbi:MAG: DciA family protein [Candidatus Omnitrophota bacterium]|jgi:hypothetical protein